MPPTVELAPKLKATVIPTSLMRATCLGDFLKNFGASDETIRIAQQGYAEGRIAGLTIKGISHDGHIEDEATLLFDQLVTDPQISVDVSSGRSMIEAVSSRFGHAVAYSVATMKRKGLRLQYFWHLTPRVNADPDLFQATCAHFNLVSGGTDPTYRPGHAPRRLFEIRPGLDKGTSYSHSTARKKKS